MNMDMVKIIDYLVSGQVTRMYKPVVKNNNYVWIYSSSQK
jgi:hypothetical protein